MTGGLQRLYLLPSDKGSNLSDVIDDELNTPYNSINSNNNNIQTVGGSGSKSSNINWEIWQELTGSNNRSKGLSFKDTSASLGYLKKVFSTWS